MAPKAKTGAWKGVERRKLPFRFLDLPGEVRNMIYVIYEASFQGPTSGFKPIYGSYEDNGRRFALYHHSPSIYIMNKSELTFNEPFRGRRALAQVCQQLRNEYRPIYIWNLSGSIKWQDLPNFQATFIKGADEIDHTPERLCVYLLKVKHDNEAIGMDFVDIYPLLKMRAARPEFNIIFDDKSMESLQWSMHHPNCSTGLSISRRLNLRAPQACYELNDLFRDGLDSKCTGGMAEANIREVRVYRWAPGSKKEDWMSIYALDVNAPTLESEFKPVLKGASPSHKTGYYYVPAKQN
ncbi:hypothetical protein K491DRAFT_721835 [Lophiostoma macrostomum CBS 122681]|uniref:F-box domain-containing protein n=1 Tax=Lophiostoma macrostomum CBS 122681 TaxID=1314788 RepID=A0A6A6SQJ4_9PLEO|nr:hypothetical protein K491DRAFT_721835 [Lophiostoma macrostomum CBS 122681]